MDGGIGWRSSVGGDQVRETLCYFRDVNFPWLPLLKYTVLPTLSAGFLDRFPVGGTLCRICRELPIFGMLEMELVAVRALFWLGLSARGWASTASSSTSTICELEGNGLECFGSCGKSSLRFSKKLLHLFILLTLHCIQQFRHEFFLGLDCLGCGSSCSLTTLAMPYLTVLVLLDQFLEFLAAHFSWMKTRKAAKVLVALRSHSASSRSYSPPELSNAPSISCKCKVWSLAKPASSIVAPLNCLLVENRLQGTPPPSMV